MNNLKVLIVDDQDWVHEKTVMELGDKNIKFLKAVTLEEGQKLFDANNDISLVVMDACVSGDKPNSGKLILSIRKKFKGPIIAISSLSAFRRELVKIGCDDECKKGELSQKIVEILNL